MKRHPRKILTIVTEAVLEPEILERLTALGIGGYTIDDVRGRGRRGVRRAEWEQSRTIRIQIVEQWPVLEKLILRMKADFEEQYALFIYVADVEAIEFIFG